MNFDYIETSTFISKDKIYLGDLKYISSNVFGWDNYSITYKEHNEMKIRFNNGTNELKISGSLPYFIDGQNFSNDLFKLKEAVYILSDTLDLNLFESHLKCFESGITFETPIKPSQIFNSHYKINGMETKPFKHGLLFEDTIRQIKLYNAGYRLKKVLTKEIRTELYETRGYNFKADYLRLEARHKKPERFYKKVVLLKDLFEDEFIKECNIELISTYDMIKKEGSFEFPEKKRDCTLPIIELIALKEAGLKYGFNPEESIRDIIRAIPESTLNKEDKKNRNKSLKALLKKINRNEGSSYDLSNELKEALKSKPFI